MESTVSVLKKRKQTPAVDDLSGASNGTLMTELGKKNLSLAKRNVLTVRKSKRRRGQKAWTLEATTTGLESSLLVNIVALDK